MRSLIRVGVMRKPATWSTCHSLFLEEGDFAVKYKHGLDLAEEEFADAVEQSEKVGVGYCTASRVLIALDKLVKPDGHIYLELR